MLRNWERLRSGISLGGSAGMGWTVWKYLEKWLGKGIVRKISFGGSGMNHLERRGEDKRLDRDKGNSSGEFFLGFRISHWMSLFMEKGS